MTVPFFRPDLGPAESEAVSEVLQSGWLTSGKHCRAFEEEFAEYVGADHALAVNSCTAALHLALIAHDIGPGDEVLVPTMTFAATSEVCIAVGATPVLVDVNPLTMGIDIADARSRVTARTRAIMVMHYGGGPADLKGAVELAKEFGGVVIEDAAHALPTTIDGQRVGSFPTTACFSFYVNKNITTGEGGMMTSPDADLIAKARSLSLHGLSRDAWNRFRAGARWEYDIAMAGWKYNQTDIAAAIGRVQLERCDEFADARRTRVQRYVDAFASNPSVDVMDQGPLTETAAHLFVIRLALDTLTIDRNAFIEALNVAGVGTSVHYKPLHMHTLYRDHYGYAPSDLPVAQDLFSRIISLPLFPSMTEDEQSFVVDAVESIAKEHCAV